MNRTASEIDAFTMLFEQAMALQRAGDYASAIAVYQQLLQNDKNNTDVLNLLGLCHYQTQDYPEALKFLKAAVKLADDYPDYHLNYGSALRAAGKERDAEKEFRRVIQLQPQNWQARINLARILVGREKYKEAERFYREAFELNSASAVAQKGWADMLFNQKKFQEAKLLYEEYIKTHTDEYEAYLALGSIYFSLYDNKGAEALLRKAISFPSPGVEAYFFHAQSLRQLGRNDECYGAFRMALSKNPDHFESRVQFFDLLNFISRMDEADQQIEYIYSKPEHVKKPLGHISCMKHFINSCDYERMREIGNVLLRKDIFKPEFVDHISLSGLVQAYDDKTNAALYKVHKAWGEGMEAITSKADPISLETKPGKIRLGFLSSDLRRHSVGKFAFPLLTEYDRNRFEIYCYSSAKDDGDLVQEELKKNVAAFRFLGTANIDDIAKMIAADNIDILIELNGFTLGTRLGALAYKPAPIQMEWLGYPCTTGLKECDYYLVDEYLKPEKSLLVEEAVVLPNSCFVSFGEFEPVEIARTLPVEKNGYITFGSLNNIYKLTPQTIELWAEVMNKVPNSRLEIVRREFSWKKRVENITKEFERLGISADRLNFIQNRHESFYEHYNDMDISLDTVPLTGGTTTADALWMGVPVISLVGEQLHERISYTILAHAGAPELAVKSKREFVDKAVNLANDIPRLKKYRNELRDMMRSSSLCQTKIFNDSFQNLMEQLVKKHGLRK